MSILGVTTMTISYRTLLTAGLSLALGSAALADENFAHTSQSGDGNSGAITQGPGDRNDVGTTSLAARQSGSANILSFVQSGDDNAIGGIGTGFLQSSNRNSATITQSSDNNSVGQVTQIGIASADGGDALRRNILTIEQKSGDGNSVGVVAQARSAASTSAPSNTATIVQSGGGNVVNSLTQSGYAELAILSQTGDRNVIDAVEQLGSRNSATLSLTGSDNGTTDFDSSSDIVGAWGALAQGRVRQSNDFSGAGLLDGNLLSLTIVGDNNSFGFLQTGEDNVIDGLVGPLGSDGNQTGVIQLGTSNLASFTVSGSDNLVFIEQGLWSANVANEATVLITGDRNQVGARQGGTGNVAAVDIGPGNDNIVNISQESPLLGNTADLGIVGNLNVATLFQSGNNTADIDIRGNSNKLSSSQTGQGNALAISIWGNGNNSPINGGFSGIALTTSQLTEPDLMPGMIFQNGSRNSITYDVGNAINLSHDNKFAFSQVGNDNEIQGLTIGSQNQVVIVQRGDLNFTSFTQIGVGNTIGVSQ